MQTPLLSNELRQQLPALHSQDDVAEPMVQAKFYLPTSDGKIWYVVEGEQLGEDFWFSGWCVVGFDHLFGEISLRELEEIEVPMAGTQVKVLRDFTFTPQPISEVLKLHS